MIKLNIISCYKISEINILILLMMAKKIRNPIKKSTVLKNYADSQCFMLDRRVYLRSYANVVMKTEILIKEK